MKWIRSQDEPVPHLKSSILTIGSFDGVHLGHKELLRQLIKSSVENNTCSVALTFRPHPRTVLRPSEPHHRLFDYRDQAEVMSDMGLDYLIEEKFSKDFSLMTADEFLNNYIIKSFNPKHIVVGYDFNFGKSREGNIVFLKQYCENKGICLTVVEPNQIKEQIISTSQIRLFLEHGQIKQANEFLGRKYYLRGPVRVGNKRGRTIGVPTANISPEVEFIPRKGVYVTKAYLGDQIFDSITNIGINPTFESTDSYFKVETHIFNFDQDIYGAHLKIELLHFMRDEIKFNSIDQLKNQIDFDIQAAKKYQHE